MGVACGAALFCVASGAVAEEKQSPPEAVAPSADAAQDPDKKTQAIGVRGRYMMLPKFMLNLFADGGATLTSPAVGLEYSSRKGNFESVAALSYARWGMPTSPFRSKNDPDEAFEIVDIKLNVLYATVDFLWSAPITDKVKFLYGGSGGAGIVFGEFTRHQAQPVDGATPGDPTTYVRCPRNADGTASGLATQTRYCASDNDHYGRDEKSWFGGGSKPVLLPWLAVQTGVRVEATDQLTFRLDLGFGVTGVYFGLAGQYGLL